MRDPEAVAREVATLFVNHAPELFEELTASRALGPLDDTARGHALLEWECFALYACVRGIVAGNGFNRETARAIEVMHDVLVPSGLASAATTDAESLRARIAERYDEYGTIGQEGGASGAATVTERLGLAAARHMLGSEPPAPAAETIGHLHESLTEGVAELVRGLAES
jgi:hypothetical protein